VRGAQNHTGGLVCFIGRIEQISSGSPSTLCAFNWRSAPLSLLSRNIVVPSTTGPQGAIASEGVRVVR
jgi:hypothetical protein